MAATLGELLLIGSGAIKVGANIFGGIQAIKQSKYQQDILQYQAKYLQSAQKIGEEKIRRNVRQIISAQRAATAASGFVPDVGTPLELQVDAEIQGDIDIALLRQAGSIEQLRLITQGHMTRAEGYGIASGLYWKAGAAGLDTLLSIGSRHGWFKPAEKKVVKKV